MGSGVILQGWTKAVDLTLSLVPLLAGGSIVATQEEPGFRCLRSANLSANGEEKETLGF